MVVDMLGGSLDCDVVVLVRGGGGGGGGAGSDGFMHILSGYTERGIQLFFKLQAPYCVVQVMSSSSS